MLKGITSAQLTDRQVVEYIKDCHVQSTADNFITIKDNLDGTFEITLDGAFCEWDKHISREHIAITREAIDYNILHNRY